jgi:hypothetical protein
MEPKTLNAYLDQHSVSEQVTRGDCLEADGQHEIEALLRATLADWIDLLSIPTKTIRDLC